MTKIGIIAYGSLIINPGREIEELIDYRANNITTSFKVEFARKSKTRDYAPTLVPVRKGGSYVDAVIFVLSEGTTLELALDVLYRREIHKVGSKKRYRPGPTTKNKIRIKQLKNRYGVNIVIYAAISPNIRNRNFKKLAKLAINSAKANAGKCRKDGITYLREVKEAGITTPLISEYEKQICNLMSVENLEEAYNKARQICNVNIA